MTEEANNEEADVRAFAKSPANLRLLANIQEQEQQNKSIEEQFK